MVLSAPLEDPESKETVGDMPSPPLPLQPAKAARQIKKHNQAAATIQNARLELEADQEHGCVGATASLTDDLTISSDSINIEIDLAYFGYAGINAAIHEVTINNHFVQSHPTRGSTKPTFQIQAREDKKANNE